MIIIANWSRYKIIAKETKWISDLDLGWRSQWPWKQVISAIWPFSRPTMTFSQGQDNIFVTIFLKPLSKTYIYARFSLSEMNNVWEISLCFPQICLFVLFLALFSRSFWPLTLTSKCTFQFHYKGISISYASHLDLCLYVLYAL